MSKILNKIKWKIREFKNLSLDYKMIRIRRQVNKIIANKNSTGPKIMFALSYNVYWPNKVHDFLLTQSLILRGATVVPLIEGRLQEGEFGPYSGVSGGFSDDLQKNIKISQSNVDRYLHGDYALWNYWSGLNPINLSEYLSKKEKEALRALVNDFDILTYKNWVYEDMPVGTWIDRNVCGNELIGEIDDPFKFERQIKNNLLNIIIMTEAITRAIKDINPNVIFSNCSFYPPYSITEFVAKKLNIPFYNHVQGEGRKSSWHYNFNAPAFLFDTTELWKAWENVDLTEDQSNFIKKYLKSRISGHNMVLNTANTGSRKSKMLDIDYTKPTALLAANTAWDAAGLVDGLQFKSMFEWLRQTVEFLKNNQQVNLIIKAHPAEINPQLPRPRQMTEDEVMRAGPLTPNITFLGPTTKFSIYELFSFIKVGLVFNSTAGLEMACNGIPVITSGVSPYYNKGFTFDPKTQDEYFLKIVDLLNKGVFLSEKNEIISKAQKLFYLYHFVHSFKLDWFDFTLSSGLKLQVSSAKELLPGRNMALDYVCDTILNKMPIFSKTRSPNFEVKNFEKYL